MDSLHRYVLGGALLTTLFLVLSSGPGYAVGSTLPGPLPSLGLGADAAGFYVAVFGAIGTLAALAVAVAAGVHAQRRYRVARALPRTVGAAGAGGAAIALVAVALLLGTNRSPVVGNAAVALVTVLLTLVTVPLVALVAAVAGVTVERRTIGRDDSRGIGRRSDGAVDPGGRVLVPVWAAVTTALAVVTQSAMNLLLASGPLAFPTWLPRVGSAFATIVAYDQAFAALAEIVLLGGALGLGWYVGRAGLFAGAVRSFVARAAAGSAVGATLAWAAVTWVRTTGAVEEPLLLSLAGLASTYVSTALVATLGAVAGLGAWTDRNGDAVGNGNDSDRNGTDADGLSAAENPSDGRGAQIEGAETAESRRRP